MASGKLSRGSRKPEQARRARYKAAAPANEARRRARHAKRLAEAKAKVGVIIAHGTARALRRKASGKSKTLPKILQAQVTATTAA